MERITMIISWNKKRLRAALEAARHEGYDDGLERGYKLGYHYGEINGRNEVFCQNNRRLDDLADYNAELLPEAVN